jgi:hypothetical protein
MADIVPFQKRKPPGVKTASAMTPRPAPRNSHELCCADADAARAMIDVILHALPNMPASVAGEMSGELAEIRMRLGELADKAAWFSKPPKGAA